MNAGDIWKEHVSSVPLSGATRPRRRRMNMSSCKFSTDSGNDGTFFMDSTLPEVPVGRRNDLIHDALKPVLYDLPVPDCVPVGSSSCTEG
jgi:hypothetical protein